MDQGANADADEWLVELTAEIVSAYVGNNIVQSSEVPALIRNIHGALLSLSMAPGSVITAKQTPAVPIKRSVQKDQISCLECGLDFKSLKRHLLTHHQLTPARYREKWNLPPDYPMVAPAYAEARSRLARDMGLGQKRADRKA